MFHSLTRLLCHTENATPLEELRNAWWAAKDQWRCVWYQMSGMFAAHYSLRQQYEDEGRNLSERLALSQHFNEQLKPFTEERDRLRGVMLNAEAAYEKAKAEVAKLLVAFELSGDGGTLEARRKAVRGRGGAARQAVT